MAGEIPSGLPRLLGDSLSNYSGALLSGGPGKDGIPSIDKPKFIDANAANQYLDPNDIVFGIYLQGQARAYPQRILVWHEIVNDQIGDTPLGISYCPLTATAIGFRRGAAEFGVSGRLLNSNVVMYDRTSDSLWSQIAGVAIDGAGQGQFLDEVRVVWTTWAKWQARHPQTQVLSRDTGSIRNYASDPYGGYNPPRGYYAKAATLFPVQYQDPRLHAKQMILGFRSAEQAIVVDRARLKQQGVIYYRHGNDHYVIIADPDLDTGWVFRSATPYVLDREQLRFTSAGPQAPGLDKLEAVNTFDAMWFAWFAFYPATVILNGD
ncbi:MAG: DUF3179 domain-containing protein [Pseudomonas sp.]|uniref:DUF3179 domain-containing protein n=1 Tax=Pseudomonas sp. TaxID=306 RepID=UPI003BB77931